MDNYPTQARQVENPIPNQPQPDLGINRIRTITIEQLNYGYLVRVGCHSFGIEKHEDVSVRIAQYLKEPEVTEKKWFTGELFK